MKTERLLVRGQLGAKIVTVDWLLEEKLRLKTDLVDGRKETQTQEH